VQIVYWYVVVGSVTLYAKQVSDLMSVC